MLPGTTEDQFRLILQNLLAERFGLKVHRESRSVPGYELGTAPGGPRLSQRTPEPMPDGPLPHWSEDSQGFPVMRTGQTGCLGPGGWVGTVVALKVTCRESMNAFARYLGTYLRLANASLPGEPRPEVIDRTGLTGTYEFRLVFRGTMGARLSVSSDLPGAAPGGPAPSLFDAVQKQLGLRLVKTQRVPATYLVVDSVRKIPAEN